MDSNGLALLAADIANAEAVRAVKRLQHAWGHYAEAGDHAAMADLFAREGRLLLPPAEASGRDAILALIRQAMGEPAPDRLDVRLLLSPVVSVAADGMSAKGRWHEIAMTGQYGANARWSGGIHENLYVLKDGVWKIGLLHYHPQYEGPYRDGWSNVSDNVPLVPYHFTPDSAGVPVPLQPLVREGPAPDRARLAARAQALVDEGLIHNLFAAYGQYLDRKLWDDVAELFTDNGALEIGGEGGWIGRADIRRGLERFGPVGLKHGELFDHLELMPVVTLAPDRRSAVLRGVEVRMLAVHGKSGAWGVGICDARFVKGADGKWRISALRIAPRMLADYAAGWDRDLPPLAASTAYPRHRGPRSASRIRCSGPGRRRSR
ncbi:MAG: nuclear transport factor 2 family protein [Sphingomonas sp.]